MTTHPRPVRVGARLTALARALGALAVLGACLIGAPLLMWQLIGWPLPHDIPTRSQVSAALTRPLDQHLLVGILGCLFWYLYLTLLAATLTETLSRATGRHRPRLPTAGVSQAVTTALVGTILTGLILTTSRAKLPAAGPPATLAAYRPPPAATAPAHPSAVTAEQTAAFSEADMASLPTCVVPAYASLWSLAQTHLGDPLRYGELFTLNEGLPQPDGGRLTDPDLIRPGWILRLPADATHLTPPSTAPSDAAQPAPATAPAPYPARTPWLPAIPPAPSPPASTSPATSPPSADSPAPVTPTPPAAPAHPRAPAARSARPVAHPDPIRLPSGPVLPVSLLAALTIAVTLARLLRHRTRRPRAHQPADPPLPLIIREILSASRTLHDPEDPKDPGDGTPVEDGTPSDPQDPGPDENDEDDACPPAGDPTPPGAAAVPLPPPYPDLVSLSDDVIEPARVPALLGPPADTAVAAARPPRPGLHGPAAPLRLPAALHATGGVTLPDADAARALILTVLASHHTPAGEDPHHLILSRDAATTLALPEQLLTRLPHLTLTSTEGDALAHAEARLLTRVRLADEHAAGGIDELRRAAPDEHLTPVLLVLVAHPDLHTRLNALAAHGTDLDVRVAALGAWPGHPYWPDPLTTSDPAWALPADPAGDLLDLLDQATPIDTPAHVNPDAVPAQRPDTDPAERSAPAPAGPADIVGAARDEAVKVDPAPTDTADAPPQAAPALDEDAPSAPASDAAPGEASHSSSPSVVGTGEVRLVLLDARPHLRRDDRTVYQGRLALEIAGYLAVHRRPATAATLLAALLPDVDPDRAKDQIYQAIRRLRDALRQAGADQALLSDRNGYRLTDTVSADLWDVEHALTAAGQAPDDPGRISALRAATGLYTGRLLEGCEWATAHATDLEHRMIDATADLADLIADEDPTAAASVLDHALGLFPYTESLYAHLMRLHAAAWHPADVHRVYRRLLSRLADLGATPSADTDTLLARLTRPPRTP